MSYPEDKPWLGGHADKTHIDEGAAAYLARLGVQSVIDIGCATGGMCSVFTAHGIRWMGIEGDERVIHNRELVVHHDYTEGPYRPMAEPDLAWCVEFLEHVEERFMPNYFATLARCTYVMATAAPPGKGGHHHVNLRDPDYWRGAFAAHGFALLEKETEEVRAASTMAKPFVRERGMLFRRCG